MLCLPFGICSASISRTTLKPHLLQLLVCVYAVAGRFAVCCEQRLKYDSRSQRIEAPVRDNNSADKGYAYDGKDISERQTTEDRLMVDQNQPEEQRFLGTEVAFPDALRFKGAAPEIVNSRCVLTCQTVLRPFVRMLTQAQMYSSRLLYSSGLN